MEELLDPQSIMESINKLLSEISRKNEHLGYLTAIANSKKKEYSRLMRKEIETLIAAGHKTGVIIELAKGSDSVSLAREDYDNAKSTVEQLLNEMQDKRVEIEAKRSLLTWARMEWQAGNLIS